MKIIFEYQDIEAVAIPIISSGNYGFDFEYAFRIDWFQYTMNCWIRK